MRRLLIALVLGGMALAALVLPANAQTAPPATVKIDPFSTRCVDPGANRDVPISGQATGTAQVQIAFFSPAGALLSSSTAPVGRTGFWNSSFVFGGYTATGEYEVRVSTASKPVATASVYLEVPCQPQTLEFNPPCFTPGVTARVTFTARHFVPNQDYHYFQYDYQGPEIQRTPQLLADNHGVFSYTFTLKPLPSNRAYPGRASDSDGVDVALADWLPCPPPTTTTEPPTTEPPTVPSTVTITLPPTRGTTTTSTSTTIPPTTPGATLTITPTLGPPGFVATAKGTGFPAGTVELTWLPGIGKTSATVAADGTFTTQLLVFPKDRLGKRQAIATGGGATATDDFLVLAPTVQPSSGSDVTRINLTRRLNQR